MYTTLMIVVGIYVYYTHAQMCLYLQHCLPH